MRASARAALTATAVASPISAPDGSRTPPGCARWLVPGRGAAGVLRTGRGARGGPGDAVAGDRDGDGEAAGAGGGAGGGPASGAAGDRGGGGEGGVAGGGGCRAGRRWAGGWPCCGCGPA